jgi:hypothetical protein
MPRLLCEYIIDFDCGVPLSLDEWWSHRLKIHCTGSPWAICTDTQVRADMFKAGKEDRGEGACDDNPIEIPQLQSSTFDLFVEHHFGL